MGRTCFVPHCKSGYRSNKCLINSKVPMFKAPRDLEKLEKWRRAIPRADRLLTSKDYVCALHFPEESVITRWTAKIGDNIIHDVEVRPRLAAGAVPCILGMPTYCVAVGCMNAAIKSSCVEKKVSFHRFPLKDKALLNAWMIKLRREGFTPSISSKICSEHFNEDDFVYQPFTNRRGLKTGAIPTKFAFDDPPAAKTGHTSNKLKFPLSNQQSSKGLKAVCLPKDAVPPEKTSDAKAEYLRKARDSALKCSDMNMRVRMLIEIVNHCLYFHEVENNEIENLAEILLADLEQVFSDSNLDVSDETKVVLEKFRNTLNHSQIKGRGEIVSSVGNETF